MAERHFCKVRTEVRFLSPAHYASNMLELAHGFFELEKDFGVYLCFRLLIKPDDCVGKYIYF